MSQLVANDVDTHEMIPGHLLGGVIGPIGEVAGKLYEARDRQHHDPSKDNMYQPGVFDTMEINDETVWDVRGPAAPAAIDFDRRVEVMDQMGVEKQLVFPTSTIGSMIISNLTDDQFRERYGADFSAFSDLPRQDYSRHFLEAYNGWISATPVRAGGRIRHVGVIPTSPDINVMIEAATKLVEEGVRAVYFQADQPPGAVSPAHSSLDPLWKLLQDNDVVATLHIGSEYNFVDPRWSTAETFADQFQSDEIPNNDVRTFSIIHFAVENYLSALVLGGVFERFPRLRVGIFEVGAYWMGPAARRMDMYTGVFPGSSAARLPMKPSEYIARNVRVSPFCFEAIDRYFQDDPNLADVYCYSSDYPHTEGGTRSMEKVLAKIQPLGEEITTKYLRTNAEWILPD